MTAAQPNAPRVGIAQAILRILSWPSRGPGTLWASALLILVLAVGVFIYAWQRWGGLVVSHPRYALTAESLQLPEQPSWIPASVKEEVMRDGNLGALSLLDPLVTVKVARAFGVHTWVADVKRVRKQYPSHLIVELEYRRPVAMVEVVTRGERGLLPVDGRGVLLPPQDFTSEQSREFIRLSAGDTLPAGPAGTPWGDERVAGAAQIAALLLDTWKQFDLHRVIAVTPPDPTRRRPVETTYELTTRSGTRILWGHLPEKEVATEVKADEKIARLKKLVEQYGKLPSDSAGADIDIRDHSGVSVHPRAPGKNPAANAALPQVPVAPPQATELNPE